MGEGETRELGGGESGDRVEEWGGRGRVEIGGSEGGRGREWG